MTTLDLNTPAPARQQKPTKGRRGYVRKNANWPFLDAPTRARAIKLLKQGRVTVTEMARLCGGVTSGSISYLARKAGFDSGEARRLYLEELWRSEGGRVGRGR